MQQGSDEQAAYLTRNSYGVSSANSPSSPRSLPKRHRQYQDNEQRQSIIPLFDKNAGKAMDKAVRREAATAAVAQQAPEALQQLDVKLVLVQALPPHVARRPLALKSSVGQTALQHLSVHLPVRLERPPQTRFVCGQRAAAACSIALLDGAGPQQPVRRRTRCRLQRRPQLETPHHQ